MGATSNYGKVTTVSPTLAPGSQIRHYQLGQELGRGGMGVVYEARDTKLGRRVAIKLLHSTTRDVADRFLVEARATARCTHENIVVIHEVDEHDGIPYMVLELVEGRSLHELLGSPMQPARAIEILLQISRALQRAHGLGIVHRDLKPENVLVTETGQVKVLDFGIAKALGESNDSAAGESARFSSLQLTADGAIVGTLPYMAPEQMGMAAVDHRSDLWALGVIAYELLAGKHPIEPTNDALIENLLSAEPMPSARDITGVPPGLAAIVDACLAKQKTARVADATTVVNRLEALRVERRSGEIAPVHAVAPPRQRSSRWLAALAGVLVVGAAATAVIVLRGHDEVPPATQATSSPVSLPDASIPVVETPALASEPDHATEPTPELPVAKPHPKPKPKPRRKPEPRKPKPCDIYGDRVGC